MKTIYFFALACLLAGCSNLSIEEKSTSLKSEHLVAATNWFQNSAEMRACYYQTYRFAKLQLQQNQQNYTGNKPMAVVLDLDETILDNSPFQAHLIKYNEVYNSMLWHTWTEFAQAKALPGAKEFVEYAKSLNVEVFYISNRKVNELKATIMNLSSLKFPNADTNFVFLRNNTSDKTTRREKVSNQYEIILFVGDNLTDFSEIYKVRGNDFGFAQVDADKDAFGSKYIILPNPMYGTWESALYNGNNTISWEEKSRLRHKALKGY